MANQVRSGQLRKSGNGQVFVVIESQRGRAGEEKTMVVVGFLSPDGKKVAPESTRCRSTVADWPVVGRIKLAAKGRKPGHSVDVVE